MKIRPRRRLQRACLGLKSLEGTKELNPPPMLRRFCLKWSDSFTCRKVKVKFSQCSLPTFSPAAPGSEVSHLQVAAQRIQRLLSLPRRSFTLTVRSHFLCDENSVAISQDLTLLDLEVSEHLQWTTSHMLNFSRFRTFSSDVCVDFVWGSSELIKILWSCEATNPTLRHTMFLVSCSQVRCKDRHFHQL